MRISISKYKPKDRSEDDKRCFCKVRNKWVLNKPEEVVRQEIIGWLCEEMDVPIERIGVESAQSMPTGGKVGRADIIVYDNDNAPIFVVECKRENEELTDDVVDQAIKYAFQDYIGVIAVTNGIEVFVYLYIEDEDKYFPLEKVPAYEELLNPGELTQYIEKPEIWKRPSFEQISDTDFRNELGCIGEDTPEHLHRFISNLCCFFWDKNDKMQPQDVYGLLIEDLGLKYSAPGTPEGGWKGHYRIFRIAKSQSEHEIGIAVIPQDFLEKEPNRYLGTNLVVSIYSANKPHNSLQLCLDVFVEPLGNKYSIWHNGTIRKKGIKNSKVLDFIRQRAPDMVKRDERGPWVDIGLLDSSSLILWEQEATRNFVGNLLRYALLRDEFILLSRRKR